MVRTVRVLRVPRVLPLLGAVALAGLVAAGCAIPTQSRPSTIAPNHVPFSLLSPHSPTTSTTQPPLTSLVPVKIFLLDPTQQLTPVQRLIVSPAPLSSVLASLVVGPTSSEAANGTNTAIPSSVRVLSVSTEDNVVTVNFNSAFAEITGAATELAVSQVVATVVTQNGQGTGVVFEISGVRTSVPIASGAEVFGPVYALQFVTAPTTTTTAPPASP
jgi:Sporulation and spore germination